MANPLLIIGNRNYSSWSFRAWLTLSKAAIEFDELRIQLFVDGFEDKILEFSSAGKVPILRDGHLTIWDSLAIAEYAAERAPQLWPKDSATKAVARSISAEMHSGFQALRNAMPMNCRATNVKAEITVAVAADIHRIQLLISQCRMRHSEEGPWLFGSFSIADAMYAPVISRFITYSVKSDLVIDEYTETVVTDPQVSEWYSAAEQELEIIEMYELSNA